MLQPAVPHRPCKGGGRSQAGAPHPPAAGASKVQQRGLWTVSRAGLPHQTRRGRQLHSPLPPARNPPGRKTHRPSLPQGLPTPAAAPLPALGLAPPARLHLRCVTPPRLSLHRRASKLPGAQDKPSARNPGLQSLSQQQLQPACSPAFQGPRQFTSRPVKGRACRNRPASHTPPP